MQVKDFEIERAVLGEILAFEDLHQKALLLDPEDFALEEHAMLCRAMIEQVQKDNKFDYLTLAAVYGAHYRDVILSCVQTAISEVLFEEHFKLLKEMASQRRLINRFHRLTVDGEVSVPTVQQMLDEESAKRLTDDAHKATERGIDDFVANLNKGARKISTGFSTVDRVLGGIRHGTVFIVGARPSVGKTAFALNVAANQLTDPEKKVMFFSLEMTAEMIYERLMAAQQGIEYKKFSQNTLTEDEVKLITENAERLKSEGRFLVLDEVYNAELICNMIRENRPDLAVVDFMQIISTAGKFENVRGRIDYISGLFKRTAKATDCVILVLSQLTRAGKDAPTMSDLKESGGLEQDGDYIALLHRPYVFNKGDGSIAPEQTSLLFDKNKFGNVGRIDLHFDLKHQRFYELDEWHESRIDRSGTAFEDEVQI